MYWIPKVIPPEEDELLYSWQTRLTKINGFSTIEEFARVFIYPQCGSKKVMQDRKVAIDGREDFMLFAKAVLGIAEEKLPEQEDAVAKLYLQTSLFPALVPLYSEMKQTQFLATAFKRVYGSRMKLAAKRLMHDIAYCPCCMEKEQQELGFYYAHRAHQLPGVQVCHLHGASLIYTGKNIATRTKQADEVALMPELSNWSKSYQLRYAVFVEELLHGNQLFCVAKQRKVCKDDYINYIRLICEYVDSYKDYKDFEQKEKSYGREPIEYIKERWSVAKNCVFGVLIERPADAKVYAQKIADLVGSEYVLSAENNGDLHLITHTVCGRTQSYEGNQFLIGHRCRICTQQIESEPFKQTITAQSCGRYSVLEFFAGDKVLLRDNLTNRLLVQTKRYILQELYRPTPSEVLPCEHPNKSVLMQDNQLASVKKYIKENYAREEVVFVEDIIIPDIPYERVKAAFLSCAKRGELKLLALGVYAFPDADISYEDVVDQRYIKRRGKQLGYLCGKSFAYEIGLRQDKPEKYYITTNKEASAHGRTVNFLGNSLHLRAPKIKINEENYKLLQLLDLIPNLKKYTDQDDAIADYLVAMYMQREGITVAMLEPYKEHYAKWVIPKFEAIERGYICD